MKIRFEPKQGLIVVPARVFGPRGDAIVRLALDKSLWLASRAA